MTDPKPTVGQQPEPEEMMNMRFMPCLDCGKDLRLCKCKPKTSPNAKLYAVHVSELMSAEMADGEDWVLVQRDGTALETNPIRALVDEQAEDGGLWFVAETITEDYLQLALRKLHAVIEATLLVTEGSKPVASPVTLSGETEEREKFRYTCNACGAMESFYQYRSNHVCPWCGEGVMEHKEMT